MKFVMWLYMFKMATSLLIGLQITIFGNVHLTHGHEAINWHNEICSVSVGYTVL